ncbi:uncharacterized protein LOC122457317 [Dermochelys coriacea]|uniref:uncharacterized protein LOC122457317 n=1 Tax=Dermochelys coriacea TaxID=27794 RepID=UPI001CA8C253|nr:uncharacterized protein LOC122457317 [Dermochelys coriacea]
MDQNPSLTPLQSRELYPKPSISVSPREVMAMGCTVTIQCDSRSYTCRSGSTSQPFVWSDPSDPVELVVRGGNDLTGLETSPYPISPGPTRTALTRRLDFTWGNILRLGLVAGVLLALVLIMAKAGYCRKETSGEPGSSHAETKISLGEEPYLLGGLHKAQKPLSLPPGNPCFRESHIYSMVLPTQQPDPWEQTLNPRHRAHQLLWHQLREHLSGPQGVGKQGRSRAQCRDGAAYVCGKPRVGCGELGAV